MKFLTFNCPDCHVSLSVLGAVKEDDRRVYLVGVCPQCEGKFNFEIDTILTYLFKNDQTPKSEVN